jgi:hypothetical protein
MFRFLLLLASFVPFVVTAQQCRETGFTSAAHTLNNPNTWFGGQRTSGNGAGINVIYHRVNWRINPDSASKGIKGTIVTHFKTTAANVNQLTFDMNATALTVSTVRFRGANLPGASIVESGSTLTISLGATIAAIGTIDSVTIDYAGVPPNPAGASIGYVKTTRAVGRNVIYTVSQPFEDRDWWICKQDINDKIDSMDIYINVPNTFKAASNGKLISVTAAGANSIYYWKHRYAIPSYLVCVGVADYVEYLGPSVNVSGTMVPMQHYLYPPSNTATVQGYCDLSGRVLDTFSNYFGDYPYKNEKYGQFQMTSFGGMEHATFSSMSTSALINWSVTVHELGHQWFGDKVTCATFNHIWLNEGFATYTEIFAAEKVASALISSTAQSVRSSTKTLAAGATAPPYIVTANTTNDIFGGSTTDIYARGAMVVSMLRLLLGDTKFFLATRNYLNDAANAYGPVTTDDLKAHMEAVSGLNLTEFFNDWVYGTGNCSYDVTWGSLGKKISLQLTQNSATGTGFVTHFDTPVPIKILGASTDTTVIIFDQNGSAGVSPNLATASNIVRIQLSFVPTGIQIDPEAKSLAGAGTVTSNAVLSLDETLLGGRNNGIYNEINLSVEKSSRMPAEYILESSANGTQFSQVNVMAAAGSDALRQYFSYKDYTLSPITWYRVKFKTAAGEWKYSNTIKIAVDAPNRLKILNNPVVNGKLNVSLPANAGNSTLTVSDAAGKVLVSENVKAGQLTLNNIDISRLAPGYYAVRLKTEDGRVYAEKLITGR